MASCPQWSLLGPILFSCYINDIPQTPNTKLCLFTDDTAILVRTVLPPTIGKYLQHHISLIEQWLINWKIKINVDKTAAVFFRKGRIIKNTTPPNIKMYGKTIKWSKSAKYLGLYLDRSLNWNLHLSHIQKKSNILKKCLIRLIGKFSPLSTYNKTLIYKMIIRPAITYGCQIWGGAPDNKIKRIEIVQNEILRMILQAPWFYRNDGIRKKLNVPHLPDFISKIAKKFFDVTEAHPNEVHVWRRDGRVEA